MLREVFTTLKASVLIFHSLDHLHAYNPLLMAVVVNALTIITEFTTWDITNKAKDEDISFHDFPLLTRI